MFKQRDYPRKLYIADNEWTVRFVRSLSHEGKTTVGLCDSSTQTITILQGLSVTERLRVFVHEVLHALEAEYNFELDHSDIELIDHPLAKVIIDNYLR